MLKSYSNPMDKKPQPLVSVCISAYNVKQVLGAALGSVLAQTYKNIEVILIDNGSTDGTYDVARSVVDERLRCIRFPSNIGGYQAMNEAIKMSKGEFVAVYHSDDIYEPTIVEKEVNYLQTYPQVGAVFCLDHFMDYEGRIFGGASLPREFLGREWLVYEEVFPFLLRNKNILFCCPTFMTRRKTLEVVGLFNPEKYGIGADLEMWIRILRKFPVGILNERLMRYRVGRNQWSNRYNYLRTDPEASFFVLDDYLEQDQWLQRLSPTDLVEYTFHRCDDNTFRAANWVIRGNTPNALELLKQPYPWRTLLTNIQRRKLRVLLLRMLIYSGLTLGAVRPLARFLIWSEYRGPKYKTRAE